MRFGDTIEARFYRPASRSVIMQFISIARRLAGGSFRDCSCAYRLRKSACFRASQMTCTTCHDPHQALRGQQAVEHYTSVAARALSTHRAEKLASATAWTAYAERRARRRACG